MQHLGNINKQRTLITNAHPESLELKLAVTGIQDLLDHIISSHQYGHPKESPIFWQQLEDELRFDPHRTLFIDDSDDILSAAKHYGIQHVIGMRQPDSQQQIRYQTEHPSITHFNELLPA